MKTFFMVLLITTTDGKTDTFVLGKDLTITQCAQHMPKVYRQEVLGTKIEFKCLTKDELNRV